MKPNRIKLLLLLVVILVFPILSSCSCELTDSDKSDSFDNDIDPSDDDNNNSSDDDNNDSTNDDDNNDNDDNNNDDNNDDDDLVDSPLIFTGQAINLFGTWFVIPSSFLYSPSGWVEYPIPVLHKKGYGSSVSWVTPMCTFDGTTSFISYNYLEFNPWPVQATYQLFQFDSQFGWEEILFGYNQQIFALHAFSNNIWYQIVYSLYGNYEMEYYNNGSIIPVSLPGTPILSEMFFLSEYEGIICGIDQATDEGIYFRFHSGGITSHPMPPGAEDQYFRSIWLDDIGNGWGISVDILT